MLTPAQSRHAQRAQDWLDAVEGWQASHGAERASWRKLVAREVQIERAHRAAYTAWLKANAPQMKAAA